MVTYQEAYEKAQTLSGDNSATTLLLFKADINLGAHKFNSALNRYFTRRAKTANIVEAQQYYQLPPDCIRVIKVRAKQSSSDNRYPLRQVASEDSWDALNTTNQTGDWATYYFTRGSDEIGIYPTPSTNITAGLSIAYEVRDKDLTQADYSEGTITLTQGSTAVTGASTTFTQSMIGRVLKVTDGTDGYWYRVASYTSATSITLEEPFIGLSGSAKTYKLGESFLFPEEYHDAPVDFALSRFYEMRNNKERAAYHIGRYKASLDEARALYASSTSSSVVTEGVEGYNFWLIPPDPITGV